MSTDDARAWLDAIGGAIDELVVVATLDGHVVWASASCARAGIAPEALLGSPSGYRTTMMRTTAAGADAMLYVCQRSADAAADTVPTPPVAMPVDGLAVILLVADERETRESLTAALEQQGHTVVVCESGGEAVGHCRECDDAIHLLLTDVAMPELDARIRKLRPGCRVLVASGPEGLVEAVRAALSFR